LNISFAKNNYFFVKKVAKNLEIQNKSIIFVSRNNNKNKNNMNYDQKFTSLAKEFEATMNHADEVMNEIIATEFEKAMVEAFNELTEEEQMAIVLGLLGYFPIPIAPQQPTAEDELAKLLASVDEALSEKNCIVIGDDEYEDEYRKEFFAELNTSFNRRRNAFREATSEPKPTFLEVGLPADVLMHLKRL